MGQGFVAASLLAKSQELDGIYGDLIQINPKPYSSCLKGTESLQDLSREEGNMSKILFT